MKIVKLKSGSGNKSSPFTLNLSIDLRTIGLLILLVLSTNVMTWRLLQGPTSQHYAGNQLYLMNEAANYVPNTQAFEYKVRQVSQQLGVAPEWLMAVMHSESKFNAGVQNYKGSGATGLIQWMPATAKDFGVTVETIRNASHIEQMDLVYKYLHSKRLAHKEYDNLTDLYLAILYPKAMVEDYCYTLYAYPEKAYTMNSGLDVDKDKRVTVQDIDRYLKRKYPTAYMAIKPGQTPSLYERVVDAFKQPTPTNYDVASY